MNNDTQSIPFPNVYGELVPVTFVRVRNENGDIVKRAMATRCGGSNITATTRFSAIRDSA